MKDVYRYSGSDFRKRDIFWDKVISIFKNRESFLRKLIYFPEKRSSF